MDKPSIDTNVNTDAMTQDKSSNPFSARTLGAQALSRSWWRRWVYPLLFLLTLMLSLATYLTLDSIQQSVNTYVNDNQLALVGGDLILESKQDWPEEVLAQVQTLPDSQTV